MLAYILRRLAAAIPVMLVVAVLVFLMLRLTPADPAAIIAGDNANAEQVAAIRKRLGLDEPLATQFAIWIGKLLQGDFGESFFFKKTVASLIADRIEPTLSLAVVTILLAVLIAVPLSFGIALFLTETCPAWLRRPLGTAIELLAAVPSIIYGMFGLFVFAPIFADFVQVPLQQILGGMPIVGSLFGGVANGLGILAAGVVLAFMVLPFIAAVMRDVFDIVPPILRESAYGLGCTTWEVVRKVVLPYTQKGVIGGVMLGLGRALGETMAVTFVIGNANRLPTSLFSPGTSIASVLANEFGEAADFHLSTLFALGFLLFVITFIVLAAAKWLTLRVERSKGT